jgi:hypothetical protein
MFHADHEAGIWSWHAGLGSGRLAVRLANCGSPGHRSILEEIAARDVHVGIVLLEWGIWERESTGLFVSKRPFFHARRSNAAERVADLMVYRSTLSLHELSYMALWPFQVRGRVESFPRGEHQLAGVVDRYSRASQCAAPDLAQVVAPQ